MLSRWRNDVAQNIKCPRKGVVGWLLANFFFKKRNLYLEKNAVRLCNIQPDHRVLEIGCGPGYGLTEAYQYVKGGNGKVDGLDYSTYMVEMASKRCRSMISQHKIDIVYGTVVRMPYNADTFDRIFHVNCYYFWPNMRQSLQEIYRVMKPGGEMITTLNLDSLKKNQQSGFMKYAYTDPIKYMTALEKCGFENVHMKYRQDKDKDYQVIFANINEKQAYNEELDDLLESENLNIELKDKNNDS